MDRGVGPRAVGPRPVGPRAVGHVAVTVVVLAVVAVGLERTAAAVEGLVRDGVMLAWVTAVVTLVAVAGLARWRTVVATDSRLPATAVVLVGGLLAYLVLPAAWRGSALVGVRVTDAGPSTFVIDLLAWSAAVAVGVLLADQDPTRRSGADRFRP